MRWSCGQVEAGVEVDDSGLRLAQGKAWGCSSEELFDDLVCVGEDEPWEGMNVRSACPMLACQPSQRARRRVLQWSHSLRLQGHHPKTIHISTAIPTIQSLADWYCMDAG